MVQNTELVTDSGNVSLLEDCLLRPWTVWVWQDAVVAVFPWGTEAPIRTSKLMAQLTQSPVVVYEVDSRLPMPVTGEVANPSALGWVEVGRHDPQATHFANRRRRTLTLGR